MGLLFWVVIFCTACKTVDAECPENCKNVNDQSRCTVNLCDRNGKDDPISCINTTLNTRTDPSKDINYITEYEDGNVTRYKHGGRKIQNATLYPVLFRDTVYYLEAPIAYKLINRNKVSTGDAKKSVNITKTCYFQVINEIANASNGSMAGGKKIKIKPDSVNPIMQPMNKPCNLTSNGEYCITPMVYRKGKANLTFTADHVKYIYQFKYDEPNIKQSQNTSYFWGGRQLVFTGRYLSDIKNATLSSCDNTTECKIYKTNEKIECRSPSKYPNSSSNLILELDNSYEKVIMFKYYPNPKFEKASIDGTSITIKGQRLNEAANSKEYQILVGDKNCTGIMLESNQITCTVPDASYLSEIIEVKLHEHTITVKLPYNYEWLYFLGAAVIVLVPVLLGAWYIRFGRRKKKMSLIPINDHSSQLMSVIVRHGIPFHKPSDYIKRILWTHKPPGYIQPTTDNINNMSHDLKRSLEQFENLLKNKYFLIPLLEVLEKGKCLTQKFTYSYHLSLLLLSDLRYFLELCEELFVHLISRNKGSKCNKLMSSCSSITEYMIFNWLGISMYSHMKENIGDMLYFFTHDLQSYLEEMPIDEVTGNTYQYLFEKYQLKKNVTYEEIKIQVDMGRERKIVSVFTCDSIVQLKKKCLAMFYPGKPVSSIPDVDDICVEYHRNRIDEFKNEENLRGFTQHLTVENWNIQEDDVLTLTFSKVPNIPIANARYTTLGATVARITTKSNRKFMHIQEPDDAKPAQSLRKKDVNKIALPVNLEYKLMELIYKFLDVKDAPAPQCYLYNLFKKNAKKNGNVKTWIINSYFIQFCCQLIAKPNILLDINQELYIKKNLEGIKNYTSYTIARCLREPYLDPELDQKLTGFLSKFSHGDTDITKLMSTLQNVSNDIMRDVGASKYNSLYYIFKTMKPNHTLIHSALMKEGKASQLGLGERFISIIAQFESAEMPPQLSADRSTLHLRGAGSRNIGGLAFS